ncbi:MAG: archaemetzincin family Zn-dependent metalloprotease [Chitinivibrionales bacterium]
MSPVVRIIPVGDILSIPVEHIAGTLQDTILRPVVIAQPLAIPAEAWDSRRNQFRGEQILAYLKNRHTRIDDDVLGIIDRDCYAQGLNYIFGQASMRTHTGFVSLCRLRENFYDRPENDALFLERILTECVHELGHMWGLPHCGDPRCGMHYSNTLADTDYKRSQLCTRCRGLLHENYRRQP